MNTTSYENALAHGLSRVNAGVLEQQGSAAVMDFFVNLQKTYPNRRLNKVETELKEKFS
jgi:hypothetical protein